MTTTRSARATHSIVITHVFHAPRPLVFRQWLNTEDVSDWFAPEGYTTTFCEIDARVGGRWCVEFASRDGEGHIEHGVFQEIIEPVKLVFTLTQQDRHGNAGPETLVTVTFHEVGTTTQMRFQQTGYLSRPMRDANTEGWRECLAKLDRRLGTVTGA